MNSLAFVSSSIDNVLYGPPADSVTAAGPTVDDDGSYKYESPNSNDDLTSARLSGTSSRLSAWALWSDWFSGFFCDDRGVVTPLSLLRGLLSVVLYPLHCFTHRLWAHLKEDESSQSATGVESKPGAPDTSDAQQNQRQQQLEDEHAASSGHETSGHDHYTRHRAEILAKKKEAMDPHSTSRQHVIIIPPAPVRREALGSKNKSSDSIASSSSASGSSSSDESGSDDENDALVFRGGTGSSDIDLPPVMRGQPRRTLRLKLYAPDTLEHAMTDPSEGLRSPKPPSSGVNALPGHSLRLVRSRLKPQQVPRPLIPKITKSNRKTLVLDLDETLIHSLTKGGRMSGGGHMVEVKLSLNYAILYYVYKRPHCDFFLRSVAKWFNLVVFTASVQEYADPILDWLEQDRKLFKARYYRQHCTLVDDAFVKDLVVVDSDLSQVIILDNSPLSYVLNEDNAIPIEGWINDPSDNDLLYLLSFLQSLCHVRDVRTILGLRLGVHDIE